MPFGPESVYRDLADRPVDLPDGEAERERSSRPGESNLAVVITTRTPSPAERRPPPNESEGVAGAERSRNQANSPAGRALDASGSEPWAMPGGPTEDFDITFTPHGGII